MIWMIRQVELVFQSTPPARGATWRWICPLVGAEIFQSTPPARGATASTESSCQRQPISIHAPREGGDTHAGTLSRLWPYFNPRPPRGGRLHGRARRAKDILHFNPRPPRGGRPPERRKRTLRHHFNPRPPRGGRPYKTFDDLRKKQISIHAPREGGDFYILYKRMAQKYFNPRPPRGGRRPNCWPKRISCYFNPRPPRGGRLPSSRFGTLRSRFQSTPPARGATQAAQYA